MLRVLTVVMSRIHCYRLLPAAYINLTQGESTKPPLDCEVVTIDQVQACSILLAE